MTRAEEVWPQGRYRWEALVRRIEMPPPVKFVGLVMATYADPDGSRVRPGVARLSAVTTYGARHIKRIVRELRGMQLIEVTRRGGGRGGKGKTTEYRLTIPSDLLDRFRLLAPEELSEDICMAPQSMVPEGSGMAPESLPGDTQTAPQSVSYGRLRLVDNPDRGDTQTAPQSEARAPPHRGSRKLMRGHTRPIEGTSR